MSVYHVQLTVVLVSTLQRIAPHAKSLLRSTTPEPVTVLARMVLLAKEDHVSLFLRIVPELKTLLVTVLIVLPISLSTQLRKYATVTLLNILLLLHQLLLLHAKAVMQLV